MPRYGDEFTMGRYMRRDVRDAGRGYGGEYGSRPGRPRLGGRDWGWGEMEGRGWDSAPRGGYGGGYGDRYGRNLDESWDSAGSGYSGRGGWAREDGYGGSRGAGYGGPVGGLGGRERSFYDREMMGGRGGNPRPGYDEDFGDRVRRGWHRLRNEARSWMGRGYDRGW